MKIEVWSDVVCPWCYIGKRRLEAALEGLEEEVELTWRSFELDPNAPQELSEPLVDMLAKKYGQSRARMQAMSDHVRDTGAADGIDFQFDRARSGNTFDAHRLIHAARIAGLGDAMKERLMLAYFTQGRLLSDHETLVELAQEVGLDASTAREALVSEATASAVRADERAARELGVRGVPFFVFEGKYGVSGAQPVEALQEVLRQVQAERAPVEASGEACGPDGCEVAAE